MADKKFNPGDRVAYIGYDSKFLKGLVGTVMEKSPRGFDFCSNPNDSLPVEWDGKGYYGVYRHNVKIVFDQPNWEI